MSLESRVPEGRGWHKDLAFWTRACRITSGRTGEVSWLMLPSELLLIIMAIHMNPYRSSSGYGLEVQTPKRGLPAQWKPPSRAACRTNCRKHRKNQCCCDSRVSVCSSASKSRHAWAPPEVCRHWRSCCSFNRCRLCCGGLAGRWARHATLASWNPEIS